ncbi:MAG: pyridoxal phosphate-dependent aminotransferase [Firmicutes bacterium]|nr:pyridoxal phosphate-dependent aminotransferase [Bacillota bacterium]
MSYNFDEIKDRCNTDCIKYDFVAQRGMPEGILPLWVADMDFSAPPAVVDALVDKSKHGIFGYSETNLEYFTVLHTWFMQNFKWDIQPEWLVKTPGVVYAVSTAIRSLTNKGDAIIIQEPVYYPFSNSVRINERKLVVNELIYADGQYSIDFEDFERKIADNEVKLFILCNPHNPVGRVWTKDELLQLGNICCKYNVLILADEIHADFVYPGFKHEVFAQLQPNFTDVTVTCTAPTKTFNLAGLQVSNIFIANETIRRRFTHEMKKVGCNQLNIMGITACKAAYAHGQAWLTELRSYLFNNLAFLRSFLQDNLPQIKLVEPEGTYLVWLDFTSLALSDEQLEDLIIHKAGLWLDAGTMFGAGGNGFQRINIACPKSVLEKALTQLAKAIKNN